MVYFNQAVKSRMFRSTVVTGAEVQRPMAKSVFRQPQKRIIETSNKFQVMFPFLIQAS